MGTLGGESRTRGYARRQGQTKGGLGEMGGYLVTVGEPYIESGVPKSGSGCPIALAVREQTPWKTAYVAGSEISEHGGAYAHSGRIVDTGSEELAEWQERFDHGLPVEPISFVLDLSGCAV